MDSDSESDSEPYPSGLTKREIKTLIYGVEYHEARAKVRAKPESPSDDSEFEPSYDPGDPCYRSFSNTPTAGSLEIIFQHSPRNPRRGGRGVSLTFINSHFKPYQLHQSKDIQLVNGIMLTYLMNKIWSLIYNVSAAIATILVGVFFVIPLAILGIITTCGAITFLFLLVLYKAFRISWDKIDRRWLGGQDPESAEACAERRRLLAQYRRRSSDEEGAQSAQTSQSPNNATRSRSNRSNSNVSLASLPQPNRDFEGVGGWLLTDDSTNSDKHTDLHDNQALFGSGSQQQTQPPDSALPSFRRRSFSNASAGINSPEMARTPSVHGRNTPSSRYHGRQTPGSVSPQSYFNGAAGRSTPSFSSRRNSRVLTKETVRVETTDSGSDASEIGHNVT